MPADWMNITTLTEREFKAELPSDFQYLISIRKIASGLEWDSTEYFKTPGILHRFHIRENIIYFTGSLSKWLIVRIFQNLWRYYFPEQYELKYVRSRVLGANIQQYPLTEEECFKSE